MDIVDGKDEIQPRITRLKASGRSWVELTRSLRAITLLGQGFGEIIRPAQDSNKLCSHWLSVPTRMDYLVSSTSMLKEICRKQGNHDARPMSLVNEVCWHKPDILYEPCECMPSSPTGACDRVQVLLPSSLSPRRHPQPFAFQRAAVVFGRSKTFPWYWPNHGDPVEGGESDSEPDDTSDFHDSGLGESVPSQVNSSPSVIMSSTPSISRRGEEGSQAPAAKPYQRMERDTCPPESPNKEIGSSDLHSTMSAKAYGKQKASDDSDDGNSTQDLSSGSCVPPLIPTINCTNSERQTISNSSSSTWRIQHRRPHTDALALRLPLPHDYTCSSSQQKEASSKRTTWGKGERTQLMEEILRAIAI